jgi:intracellular proteinase inhibitor BsuPI
MKKIIISISTLVLVLCFSGIGKADLVDISVATDKSKYVLGEYVTVYISAYNPNTETVSLGFPSALQATYIMDDIFDWSNDKVYTPVPTGLSIDPGASHIWTLYHGNSEMDSYPLNIGTHTIVGEVINYGQSTPVEFEVVPEPASFVLLLLGGFVTRKLKK